MDQAALDVLRQKCSGEVVAPSDGGYESARRVWNAMIDRRPALVVRPRTVSDVVAAVKFARLHALPVAIRGGGHGIPARARATTGWSSTSPP